VTIWELEIQKILRVPEFAMPAEEKLKTTDSGLKYEILKEGEGEVIATGKTVQAHYAGWLSDGKLFDTSYVRGRPLDVGVGLGRVIKGWDEGLQLMKRGGVFKFVIPPDLAYGANGMGPLIPPNSTLVFLVEIVAVN
jgi:FKBP-type peptidyl-prolyl cis-trans isomerase